MLWNEKVRLALNHPVTLISLMVPLGLYTVLSTLFYDVLLFIPLPGIVSSISGFLMNKRMLAFLLGAVPFVPLLLLGLPKAGIALFIGVPNGLIALGGALLTRQGLSTWTGLLLIVSPLIWMLILFSNLQG